MFWSKKIFEKMFTNTLIIVMILIKHTLAELEILLELLMQYTTTTVNCSTTSTAVLSWGVSVSTQITVLQSFIAAQIGTPVIGPNYNDLILSLANWNNNILRVMQQFC